MCAPYKWTHPTQHHDGEGQGILGASVAGAHGGAWRKTDEAQAAATTLYSKAQTKIHLKNKQCGLKSCLLSLIQKNEWGTYGGENKVEEGKFGNEKVREDSWGQLQAGRYAGGWSGVICFDHKMIDFQNVIAVPQHGFRKALLLWVYREFNTKLLCHFCVTINIFFTWKSDLLNIYF